MNLHVENLKLEGITKIQKCFSVSECEKFIQSLDEIVIANKKKINYTSGGNSTFTPNFFRHNLDLLKLIDIPIVNDILKDMIDDDYVLVACNAINRSLSEENPNSVNVGQNWHTDSRYIGGKRMQAGVFFSVVVMLDDFTKENGATSYVPNSHLRLDRPDRDGNFSETQITGKAGDVIIFDSGIWHKGGKSTHKRRWGVFNLYGPWFIKPYFNFPNMLGDIKNSISPNTAKLLHFNSIPPNDETERFSTLVK
tara:strand:- start:2227 stop:2982 length:756 start_codon:yes stop_codon:yes gene_type:complete